MGRYTIRQFIGRGGMGRVYRADGPDGERALKLIHPQYLSQKDFQQRFRLEAGAGKRIQHENVVRTYGCEMVALDGQDQALLVMEYVHGRTLLQMQRELGALPEGLLRDIATGIARGLEAVHAAGVIHRDLKPENVLITSDHRVKIMDLGVARLRSEEIRLSRTGHFVGSLMFAAPEQLQDNAVRCGPPADLYGVGLLLYVMATGDHPFPAGSAGEIINAHLNAVPSRLREVVPEVSHFLEAITATLLQKLPEDRLPSAGALREVFEGGESSEWWLQRRPDTPTAIERPRLPVRRVGPLQGRAGELRHLTEIWRRTLDGCGRVVLIHGEAGLGKSRLVDAFLEGLRLPVPCLALAVPPQGESGQSFSAMRRALLDLLADEDEAATLREILRTAPEHVDAFLEFLRTGEEPGTDVFSLHALHRLFVQVMAALCEGRPRLIVVEDIDRLSQADQGVLLDLAKSAGDTGMLLLCTARPDLDPGLREQLLRAPGARRLVLRPLDRSNATAMVGGMLGSQALARELYGPALARAGGNPLFLAEIVEGLKQADVLRQGAEGQWIRHRDPSGERVPATLAKLLSRRLDALPAAALETLEAAALQGETFDLRVTAHVLERPRLAVLEALSLPGREAPMVQGRGDQRSFQPALLRDVVLKRMTQEGRRRLHRRTAQALERLAGERGPRAAADAAARVVMHYLRGGDPEAAMPLLVGAIRRLVDAFNFHDALELADAALAYREQLDPRLVLRVLVSRARCYEKLGHGERERSTLEELRDLAEHHDLPVPESALDSHGRMLLARGEIERARRLFEEQLVVAQNQDDRIAEARAHRNLAAAADGAGEGERCRLLLERSLMLSRSAAHLAEELAATADLADFFEGAGQIERARSHRGLALDLALRSGNVRAVCAAHGGLARLALRRGRVREAQVHLDRQLHTARQTGDRAAECAALRGLGRLDVARGRLEGASRMLEKARRLAQDLARGVEGAAVYADLALQGLLHGDSASMLQYATRALSKAQLARDSDLEVRALTLAGMAAEERGDLHEAVEWYDQATGSPRNGAHKGCDLDARLGLARIWRQGGQTDLAVKALWEVVVSAQLLDLPGPRLRAEAMRATLREASPAHVRAELVRHGDRLTFHERLEVYVELAAATGDPLFQQEAQELVADLAHDLADRPVDAMASGFSLYRRALGMTGAAHGGDSYVGDFQ